MKFPGTFPTNKMMYVTDLTETEVAKCDDEFLFHVTGSMTVEEIQKLPLYISQRVLPAQESPMKCKCRNCGKVYEEGKATADWKGYCSQGCVHAKARDLGYRPGKLGTEYEVLPRAGEVGSVSARPCLHCGMFENAICTRHEVRGI